MLNSNCNCPSSWFGLGSSSWNSSLILSFAKEHGLLENFTQTFSRLESYANKGYEITLYSDFAPLSLDFSVTDNGRLILFGGIIFHGAHDGYGSGSAPKFSVSLTKEVSWSIHT